MQQLRAAGWRVHLAGGQSHAYARAYCPGGEAGCPPLIVYGSPKLPENEVAKIRRAINRCTHGKESST